MGVNFAGADFTGIGSAVELDELLLKCTFLIGDRRIGRVHVPLLQAKDLRHFCSVVEGALSVEHGAQSAFVDLLVVGLAGLQLGGRNIEGDRAWAQAEGVEVGVGVVHAGLESDGERGNLGELGHRRAVDDLYASVIGIGVFVREECVADDPVEIGALGRAGGPLIEAPVAGD